MIISPSNRQYGQSVTMNGHTFEVVDNFVYLGSQINSANNIGDEIKRRVTLGNRSYFSLLKLLRSKEVSRNLKCTYITYKSVMRPVVMYGSKSWCMTQKMNKFFTHL